MSVGTSKQEVDDYQRYCAAALAALPLAGPSFLRRLLGQFSPAEAWGHVQEGTLRSALSVYRPGKDQLEVEQRWRKFARAASIDAVASAYQRAGVRVLIGAERPGLLIGDVDPPAVLFVLGSLGVLERRRAAIIGTRHCSTEGRDIARRLGSELAEAGVAVVSGLALGIDGAAHRGALEALDGTPPVGVVGSGLDVPYPRSNSTLWREVASRGVLISEAPLGARPQAWRFPARNRIIAALAEVVVVVESHRSGGSLLTVGEAEKRGVEVMAVPGSVRSPATAGSNQLLVEGCGPVLGAGNVLSALDMDHRRADVQLSLPLVEGDEAIVLQRFHGSSMNLDEVVESSGLDPSRAAAALGRLVRSGRLLDGPGVWCRAG